LPEVDMSELLTDSFERLLADASPPDVVRSIEREAAPAASAQLWARLEASGFLDALVPEAAGGAGLGLADAFELFVADGRHVVPVPLSQTMLVRAVLAGAGIEAPSGAIAIASRTRVGDDGAVFCPSTPYGRVADWVVAAAPDGWRLLPTAEADVADTGVHASLRADLRWSGSVRGAVAGHGEVAWQEVGAVIAAAQMSGAMERVLHSSVAFAEQRVQFGRSIGKFQAIQHQLAVMAEQVCAARMAAELGCSGAGPLPRRLRAAVAKARAGEAAALVAPAAHAVHGAIGVTAELDLQLHTRRIHEWRADFGSERHWNEVLGAALLEPEAGSTLAFLHAHLFVSAEEFRP
jgi:acyl-CoA dehydrogenase